MKKHTVILPNKAHQPSKTEMEERIKIDLPGETVRERMNNFARALMRPVKIEYREK